ncbi:hypothetical protein ABID52_001771 [Fictibacillus halophilus]|uniref:Uncharacterized protein n=1 Tax=Fictibacillus halophilus TaxID=1610490 RepID=A0ABV2LHW9_9BACL|nr:hypothetical protein [Fictibacillus halophilus]
MSGNSPMNKAVDLARAKVMQNIEIIATQFGYKSSEAKRPSISWIDICTDKELQEKVWHSKLKNFQQEIPSKGDSVYLFNDSTFACQNKYKVGYVNIEDENIQIELVEEEFVPEITLDSFISQEGLSEELKIELTEKVLSSEEGNISVSKQTSETTFEIKEKRE